MHKIPVVLFLLVIIFALSSCPLEKQTASDNSLTVVSWNVQNLFNSVFDGSEYQEFLPTSGWTEQAYRNKLSRINQILSYGPLSDSDVLILNEVENNSVTEDLINTTCLKDRGFMYYATAGEPNGAIKTAVISRIPIINVQVHNVEGVRPILLVELQSLNEKIYILAIHAKSNLEGESETAPLRLKQGKMLKTVSDDILSKTPDALVIIAGDFNETFSDNNIMCDSRNCTLNCPLKLLPDFKENYWYCPWLNSDNTFAAEGSYYYNNEWKCYDNILISSAGKDGYGWEYKTGGVVFQGLLQTTDYKPNTFRRDLLTGVSDHLPVWVCFTK